MKVNARNKISSYLAMSPFAPFVGAGLLSATLLVVAFPPYGVVPFLFCGYLPFLWGVARAKSAKQAAVVGISTMVFFVLLGFSWVSHVAVSFGGLPWIVGKIVLVLFSLFGELQFLAFAILAYLYFRKMRQSKGEILWTAVALAGTYTALDWLYPKIFPNTIGHGLVSWLSVAQIAEYTGAYGLTFLILFFNVFLFFLLRRNQLPLATAVISVLIVLFTGFGIWGSNRIEQLRRLDGEFSRQFKFLAVQANIGDAEKFASENGYANAVGRVLTIYREMTIEAVKKHPEADLVIWPETAFPILYHHFDNPIASSSTVRGKRFIREVILDTNRHLYFGGYAARGRKDYNSGFLLDTNGEIVDHYHKSILLAFGEYIPLGPFSSYIQDMIPSIADFGRGAGPKIMNFQGIKLAPQICYEGLIPDFSREAVKQGADVLLNITNDSWFGDTSEPHQHLALTQFRSIELRRPMIRATNTGISTLIDITGAPTMKTPIFMPSILNGTVRLPGEGQSFPKTFYLQFGEVFAYLACALAALQAFRVGRRRL